MKSLLFRLIHDGYLLGFFLLIGCATHTPLPVFNAPTIKSRVEFLPHMEDAPFRSYLAMNLPFAPFKETLKELEKELSLSLINRGEAHITVITPVEYDTTLKKHVSIAEINQIAANFNIQNSHVTPVCIGKGQKQIDGKTEKTFFIVVKSPDLLELRRQIHAVYIKKGGKNSDFDPELFFPHVTLGFTLKDLHYEDGVIKNNFSCAYGFAQEPK